MECLSLLQSVGSMRAGAIALDVAAELAAAVGEPERAVEFYGARERILRRARAPDDPRTSEELSQALDGLRAGIGQERFDAAWMASRATPFPFEFYVCAALQWLEGLEVRMPPRVATEDGGGSVSPAPGSGNPGSTAQLITQVQEGDPAAKERLAAKYLGPLRRFAHGQLPDNARDLMDTDDLVQVTVVRALDKVHTIEPERKGGFFAYLRKILINQVRDEIRRSSRRTRASRLIETIQSGAPSPLDQAIEREFFESYESALSRLSARQREALTLRIEHGLSYQQVADAIGCPSANAARMVVSRGLVLVTEFLRKV
jgi:RNA polymerase sigma-70 factor (ECF subfamily)